MQIYRNEEPIGGIVSEAGGGLVIGLGILVGVEMTWTLIASMPASWSRCNVPADLHCVTILSEDQVRGTRDPPMLFYTTVFKF